MFNIVYVCLLFYVFFIWFCVDNREDPKHTLFKWAIHVRCGNLFVEGFVLSENGIPQLYRTSAIGEAITNRLLKTTNGSLYSLKGPICLESTLQAKISIHVAQKFEDGFPSCWKELLPVMAKSSDIGNASFHDAPVEPDNQSIWPQNPKDKKRVSAPLLEWPSFSTDCSGDSDTTLNASKLNVDVQFSSAEKSRKMSNQEAGKGSVKGFCCDPLQTPNSSQARGKPNDLSKKKRESPPTMTELANSFYRTRSGRHVFPPLQSWTGQRLVTEYDDMGNNIVVLYPGEKSLPDDNLNPVHDALRNSSWLQRQHRMNQLLQTQSKSVSLEPRCVKKLSTSEVKPQCSSQKQCRVILTPLSANKTKKDGILFSKHNKTNTSPVNANPEAQYFLRTTKDPQNNHSLYNLRKSTTEKKATAVATNLEHSAKTKSVGKSSQNPVVSEEKKGAAAKARKGKVKKNKSPNASIPNKDDKAAPQKNRTNKRKMCKSVEEPKSKKHKIQTTTTNKSPKEQKSQKAGVTARKGSLKHRLQVKAALGAIQTFSSKDDLFSVKQTTNAESKGAFSDIKFDMFTTAVTPSSKFSQNFTTPSWFKTPGSQNFDETPMQSVTPAHLRCSSPNTRKENEKEADKVVVQVQKMKRKASKSQKLKNIRTPIKQQRKQANVSTSKISSDLFNKTKDTIYSSDDEYFSDV